MYILEHYKSDSTSAVSLTLSTSSLEKKQLLKNIYIHKINISITHIIYIYIYIYILDHH